MRRDRRGEGRHGHGPLLRHGPRQALGPGGAGLRRHGLRPGPSEPGPCGRCCQELRQGRDRRVCRARSLRQRGHDLRQRQHHLLQLPPRPGPGDHPRLCGPGFRRVPAGVLPPDVRVHHRV